MLSPYLLVIGLIKFPPSDANCRVTFPTIPSSLSKVTRYLLSHQGFVIADAVVDNNIVVANSDIKLNYLCQTQNLQSHTIFVICYTHVP